MAASTVSQRGTALIPPTHPIKTRKDLPLPHLIPLPPSPPATDAFDIDEAVPDLVPDTRLTRSQSSNHASSNKPKTQSLSRSCSRPDIPAPHSKPFQKRSRDDLDLLSTAPASPISSPLSSPTAQKSSRKRARVANRSSSPSPQPLSNPRDADPFNPRDSPNNPFLVKPGESARRPGTFEKKSSRKLIYVLYVLRYTYINILTFSSLLSFTHRVLPSLSFHLTQPWQAYPIRR